MANEVKKFGGVAYASIKKIGGVAAASVKKIGGKLLELTFHTKALRFSTDEVVRNTTEQSIGIGNAFTINFWIKFNGHVDYGVPINISKSANQEDNIYTQEYPGNLLHFVVFNSTAASSTSRVGASAYSLGTVYMYTMTWDGTNIHIFRNGAAHDGTQTGGALTMANSNRKVSIGANYGGGYTNSDISKASIWDEVLTAAEITELYNSGLGYKRDDRIDVGNYASQANLKHQWALGKDATLAQSDYVASGGIDVYANAVNISSADIVDF